MYVDYILEFRVGGLLSFGVMGGRGRSVLVLFVFVIYVFVEERRVVFIGIGI